MTFVRNIALRIPAIRRLHESRNALAEQLAKPAASPVEASPFFHYNTVFDAQEAMRRHAAPDLQPDPAYLTNFLGVKIATKFYPPLLAGREGEIEGIAIPANWHADIAEWGAALRAVDLAQKTFTMIELGCGWGCWMNNTGVAARRLGLDVTLIGVEGDPGHIVFAQESLAANGFAPAQIALHHGIAAATSGTALFPRQGQAGASWGLAPIFGATAAERDEATKTGSHDVLPMLTLAELAEGRPYIDLLHVDIQGGEARLIAASLDLLAQKIGYLLIGTHSRQIEGSLFDTLLAAGWVLEIERPAILAFNGDGPYVTVDGVQGWRNPRLRP